MRLQLAVVVLVVSVASSAWAQSEVEGEAAASVLVYSDDDATTVTTTIVDAQSPLPAGFAVGAHALVDVVSSASVDVVSAATGRWTENRVEVGARAGAALPAVDLSLAYTRSQENDWRSNSVAAGASRELFERNTVVSASYAFTANSVGRAADPTFERSVDSHSVELGIGQLIDEQTRVGGAYSLQLLSGFLSSPYRFVVAADGSASPERHPDTRIRHALSGFAVRALSTRLAGRVDYRLYNDDWGIWSHTGTIRLAAQLSEAVVTGIEGRMYLQNGADFFRGQYMTSARYMSFDRELSEFWDVGGTADVSVTFGPVTADAKLGVIYYKFDDFPALPTRTALIAGGGAKVVW